MLRSPALPIMPDLDALVTSPTALQPAFATTMSPTLRSLSSTNMTGSPSAPVLALTSGANFKATSVPSRSINGTPEGTADGFGAGATAVAGVTRGAGEDRSEE